ncbi:conserved Plasmodium protein, unknown function [Plasmodium yoelii]|uniref:Uncharacterized protein n=2 Tax=Plasmodium yoelii TaxID=5861 RepID=A0AAE9WRC1_PLAYO|nr:conserved Plasmodium protein, unknown function [Plasmodium yoelii]WBY58878.1 hypothetical protein Py17XNL_001105835 [Plasmodium yoelii yoelii]CDU19133.1 conserved Plasmodium protein, unknown function [Plasmodium yoelii]VTZ79718.1 conserved Plasmodium protein, unknown function [Plasmodium yoelii]|eukprot:XP_727954.2 conserved Plasmodium protein, unknown function [Plasmodium yoelii]
MYGFKARPRNNNFRNFNKNNGHNNKFRHNNNRNRRNNNNNLEEISEYLINISYILNEKYEKYFVYELKEENVKKGYKVFGDINLDDSYNIEDDICILVKIKDEIKYNEKALVRTKKCSKILEKLIYYCFFLLKYNEKNVKNNDISIECIEIYNNFFKMVYSNFDELAVCEYASHFVQTVLCVYIFFNKYEEKYIEDINKKNNDYKKISYYFKEIGNNIIENIFFLIFDKCGTHILRSFLYSLGGYLNINISNITFRKSKVRNSMSKGELKYVNKNYMNDNDVSNLNGKGDNTTFFFECCKKIIDKIKDEIVNPNESQKFKNILYQYIFYEDIKKGEEINSNDKYLIESQNQYLISPLLYNTYSVPALVILFELFKDKKVECSDLISEIFLIKKTKKYYIDKTCEKNICFEESPLKQLLDLLIKLDSSSIMIENILKINNEHTFYVFNTYILKNINKLICDNPYSCLVIYNYLSFEYITEEMYDLLIKQIDIDIIINKKKFNILKSLFDLSQCYKRNCKFLVNSLLKNLSLIAESANSEKKSFTPESINNTKFIWLCILCMCNYNDLSPLVLNIFGNSNPKKQEIENDDIENEEAYNGDQHDNNNMGTLNNYNFYNHIKIDTNGYYILLHILSFPKESIIPIINSFKHFCNFLKIVYNNKPSNNDINNYNSFLDAFSNNNNNNNGKNRLSYEEGNHINDNHQHEKIIKNNSGNNYYNNLNGNKNENKIKPFIRKNAELRGNILLYFCCDKNLSILCEKIGNTFNLLNEKYLKQFILLFKNEYKNIAINHIGAHVVVTFFKLGNDQIKKSILDSLIENDINMYNNFIKNFMKLKEYKKTKTINTNTKKYLKAKKMFENILISKEKDDSGNGLIQELDQMNNDKKENTSDKEEKNTSDKEEKNTSDKEDEKNKSDKEDEFMNVISEFIKDSKKKSRKRKKEKDKIDKAINKSVKCS